MVEYKVIIGDEAIANLRKIHKWIRDESGSEKVAEKVKSELLQRMRMLSRMPSRHTIIRAISTDLIEYRRVLKWSYQIIFTIDEDKSEVHVVDIMHSKRNPQILKDIIRD